MSKVDYNHAAYSRRAVLPVFCAEVVAVVFASYACYYILEMVEMMNKYGSESAGLWGYYYSYCTPIAIMLLIFAMAFGMLEVLPTLSHVFSGEPFALNPYSITDRRAWCWDGTNPTPDDLSFDIDEEYKKPEIRVMAWGVCTWLLILGASSSVFDMAFCKMRYLQRGEYAYVLLFLVAVSAVANILGSVSAIIVWSTTAFKYWMFSAVNWDRRTVCDRIFVGGLYHYSIQGTTLAGVVFLWQLVTLATHALGAVALDPLSWQLLCFPGFVGGCCYYYYYYYYHHFHVPSSSDSRVL